MSQQQPLPKANLQSQEVGADAPKKSPQPKKKISFSELKIWNECPFKHKLNYVDGIKSFTGNEYTAFGTAVHYVCEMKVQDPSVDGKKIFKEKFVEEIKALTIKNINKKMVLEMKDQGLHLVDFILPELNKMFEEYEVISVEEQLYEPITEFETGVNFKGFIDLVIKTPDGKYHVIDWKTCSWGWRAERKAEPMTVYQLSFYKNYFAKKHNIDPKNIETYFALLKRTAKKDNVEIFKVTNGPKRVANAVDLLHRALTHINSKNYLKNKLSCNKCEFYKTSHCP
jgi:ATP-dependent exoDNAse (exonuclease V) beta subunit